MYLSKASFSFPMVNSSGTFVLYSSGHLVLLDCRIESRGLSTGVFETRTATGREYFAC